MVSWFHLRTRPSQTSQCQHCSFREDVFHGLVSLLPSCNGPTLISLSASKSSWDLSTNYVSQSGMSHGVFLGRVLPSHVIIYIKSQSLVVCCCMVGQVVGFQKVNWLLAISGQKQVASWSTYEAGHWVADHWLLVQLLYRWHKCRLTSQRVHQLWAPHWAPSFVM